MHRAHAPSIEPSNALSTSTDVTDGRTNGDPPHPGDISHLPDAREIQADDLAALTVGKNLEPVLAQLASALDRFPVIRTNRPGRLDEDIRRAVLRRDRWRCLWCGWDVASVPLEVDHVIPWSAGGTNATDNLRTLCQVCNQERSNRRADVDSARTLLIVGACDLCRETETTEPAAVWCLTCRRNSTTTQAHAEDIRRRQADRYARTEES